MAIARKGSRWIVVDDVTYRWRLRGRPSYCQGLGSTPCIFAVEHAELAGATLVVHTGHPHPSNWMGLPAAPVLPSTVAAAIRAAIQRGWQPAAAGRTFVLDLADHLEPR